MMLDDDTAFFLLGPRVYKSVMSQSGSKTEDSGEILAASISFGNGKLLMVMTFLVSNILQCALAPQEWSECSRRTNKQQHLGKAFLERILTAMSCGPVIQ